MKSLLLIGVALLAFTGVARAEPMDPAIARLLYGQGGRSCVVSRTSLPSPLPWWATPVRARAANGDPGVIIPVYMCPRETSFPSCGFAPGRVYVDPSPDGCEYEYAISEVLTTCRSTLGPITAAMRRCDDLRAIARGRSAPQSGAGCATPSVPSSRPPAFDSAHNTNRKSETTFADGGRQRPA
jgi:hypothetical protein